jgi:predicted pyridoxine 5'-phosphate oxidase superfamily flavin-nucleotide-binding protein
MRQHVSTVEELRAIVGHPAEYVANKVGHTLAPIHQDWLAHSPLGFVATTDADGHLDVSPKGDPPGFVHVIDEVFFHCAKAFLRSDTWKPESWNPTALPSVAQMAQALRTACAPK